MPTLVETSTLTDNFGVVVHNIDLSKITEDAGYPALRALFEEHSALLFKGQDFVCRGSSAPSGDVRSDRRSQKGRT